MNVGISHSFQRHQHCWNILFLFKVTSHCSCPCRCKFHFPIIQMLRFPFLDVLISSHIKATQFLAQTKSCIKGSTQKSLHSTAPDLSSRTAHITLISTMESVLNSYHPPVDWSEGRKPTFPLQYSENMLMYHR